MTDDRHSHITISDEAALAIINKGDPGAMQALANNPGIGPNIVAKLFGNYPEQVITNSAWRACAEQDPNFQEEIFAANAQVIPRINNLTPDWFNWLLGAVSGEVRRYTASHPNLPPHLHEKCLKSLDIWLRLGLAENINTNPVYLSTLGADANTAVALAARNNPKYVETLLSATQPPVHDFEVTPTVMMEGIGEHRENRDVRDIRDTPIETNWALVATPQENPEVDSQSGKHPFVLALLFLGLLCLALGSILLGKSTDQGGNSGQAPVAVRTNQATPKDSAVAKDPSPSTTATTDADQSATVQDRDKMFVLVFEEAITLGKQASEQAKVAKNSQEWSKIAETWQESINLLTTIPPGSKYRISAEERLKNYRASLKLAQRKSQ
jgi:hypothetical protein